MAEIYLGNNSLLDCYDKAHIDSSINDVLSRIGEGSTDVDLSGYVDASAFTEATQVTAAALVDLKKLHNEQAKYIMDLSTYDTKLDNDISTLTSQLSTKADSSNYYTKKQIDDDGKVVAAALASIDLRVSSIESSIGSDSGSSVDLSSINSSINAIENNYVKNDDISTFITSSYTYGKAHIDSSFGETYLVKITNASGYFCYVPRTMSDADREKALLYLKKNGGVVKTVRSSSAAFIGANCHAEGSECRAKGDYSHAEGYRTTASGYYSHAEGSNTNASSGYSHAEGSSTTALGVYSHAEGSNTYATGDYSHAEGRYTSAKEQYLHAEGQYNMDASTAILIVGNGTSTSSRHNALELHLSGEVKISDTYATGEAHQKPMYVLQDRFHSIDTSINNINASVNYISVMQLAVLSNVNFVIMNEIDYELITPDPSIIYFLT